MRKERQMESRRNKEGKRIKKGLERKKKSKRLWGNKERHKADRLVLSK